MSVLHERLRLAVIGVGIMGERHARVIAELCQTELVAVVDVNKERVEEISGVLGVPGYTDHRDMLAKENLDAVTVATADQHHKDPTVDSIRQGLPVFLEKPVATTLADAEAIMDATRQASGKVMVGHTLRYDSRYAAVAQAARDGKLGDIIHVYARRNGTTWSGRRIGGRTSVTAFQGVHDFDIIRWITGGDVTRVYGAAASKVFADLGVADTVMAILHLSNGAVAQVEQSLAVPFGVPSLLDARLEVIGTKGAAYIDMTPQCLSLFTDGKFTQPLTISLGAGQHLLKDMYAKFIGYVSGDCEAVATLEEGIAALRVALAVDESARTGKPVDLR